MLLIDLNDVMCCVCGGQLEIVGVIDLKLDVECVDCHEQFQEKAEDLKESGIDYRALSFAEFSEGQSS